MSGQRDADAARGREHQGTRWLKRGLYVIAGFLLFNVGTSVVLKQSMGAYRIVSSNMEPTLHCARPADGCEGDAEDRILALRLHPFWEPHRGDIVVFDTPPEAVVECGVGGTFIKRLIGLPGETVSERKGYISINGKPLKEPYVKRGHRDEESGTWSVPLGEYFFLGDNRAHSCDSRWFGSVPRNDLVGPVVAFYWPLDRFGLR